MNDFWREMENLEKLAERANSGPWSHDGHGRIDHHDHESFSWIAENCSKANGDYIAAANPKTILSMIGILKKLKNVQES